MNSKKIKQLIKKVIRNSKRTYWKIVFAGKRFRCPVCERSFSRFLTKRGNWSIKGELLRDITTNAICPGCDSGIRTRFVWKFVKEKTDLFSKRMKLLHVAPSDIFSEHIKKLSNIEYVPADIAPIDEATVKLDLRDIHFPDDSFDAVICSHVIEHIKEDQKAIGEIYRILRPNGWVLIAVPIYGETTYEDSAVNSDYLRGKIFGNSGHVRLNGLDLSRKLQSAGFEVKIFSIDDLEGNYVDRQCNSVHLQNDKYLFYCRKMKLYNKN